MILNLAFLSCYVAAVFAQYQQPTNHLNLASPTPAQFPAGVDPETCPNYPDCSNPLVTVQAILNSAQPQRQQQYQGYQQQQYQQGAPAAEPKSQYSPEVQQRLDRGEYIGDGDYHGEGLDEALAPQALAPTHQYASQQIESAPQYYQPQLQHQAQPQQASRAYSPNPAAQYTPQYASAPQYITAPQYQAASQQYQAAPQYQAAQQYQAAAQYSQAAPQYSQAAPQYSQAAPQYAQARLFNPGAISPQYSQSAPVHEARSYSPVASASEPVQSVQIPAGVDPSACPNYPFCHS